MTNEKKEVAQQRHKPPTKQVDGDKDRLLVALVTGAVARDVTAVARKQHRSVSKQVALWVEEGLGREVN